MKPRSAAANGRWPGACGGTNGPRNGGGPVPCRVKTLRAATACRSYGGGTGCLPFPKRCLVDYLNVRRRERSHTSAKLLVSMVLGYCVNRNRADHQRHPGKPSQAMTDAIDGIGGCHRWYWVLPSMPWVMPSMASSMAINGVPRRRESCQAEASASSSQPSTA